MTDSSPTDTQARPAGDADGGEALTRRVKDLLRRDLKLGPEARIADDMPLIGGEFELDSLDVVLLIGSVEKEFGIKLPRDASASRVFGSVDAIVGFLQSAGPEAAGAEASSGAEAGQGEAEPGPAGESKNAPAEEGAAPPDEANGPDLDAVLAGLPHAPPFRFVTRLTALDPGHSAQGAWEVTGGEAFFAGHFPGHPLIPGVLLSEALAQVCGLIAAAELGPQQARGVGLAHIDVRLRRPVAPPATVTLLGQRRQTQQGLMRCAVEARVAGEVVADGTLTLKLPG